MTRSSMLPALFLVLGACGVEPEPGAMPTPPTSDGSDPSAPPDAGSGSIPDAGPGATAAVSQCPSLLPRGPASQWVYVDHTGHLAYKSLDAHGDRIMDFSHAGYMGGGVALPTVPATGKALSPSGGASDTAAIQAALDAVAARPVDSHGLRGAVVLGPGVFKVDGTLEIKASGVVLRGSGSGSGASATEIRMTGAPHRFLTVHGSGGWAAVGKEAVITDDYVPAGARTVTVDDASGLHVGDGVLVRRPVTPPWVHFMGMDTLVRNGKPQTWIAAGTRIAADRVITAIEGDRITFDVPLADSYDATWVRPPGATVGKYNFPGRIRQVGVEHLRVVAPTRAAPPISEPLYTLFGISAVADGWVRDVVALETENSVSIDDSVKRLTVDGLSILRTERADGSSGYPLEVQFSGSQILIMHSTIKGDNLYTFATQARVTGPNVVLASTATGEHTRLEPHQRWATGFLADGVVHDDRLDLVNRTTAGSGHGWAIGWGVLWNSAAASINVEQPPGAANWSIGSKGKPSGDGTFDSTGTPVVPTSLYLAQLCERLGADALSAIGFSPR